jgi:DNA-directed RNA polymerase subunit RPC12/RpoP
MDKIKCPHCESDNVIVDDVSLENGSVSKSYLCLKCGFTSNSQFTTQDMIKQINNVSQLILDLSKYDELTGLHWFPIVLLSTNGSIYPEGTKDIWHWIYTPIIPIKEEERTNYGEEFNTRFAVELSEKFEKFKFLDACKKMGNVSSDLEVN